MNKPNAIPALFRDLRYIIVDEVHAFMGADRGAQLILPAFAYRAHGALHAPTDRPVGHDGRL